MDPCWGIELEIYHWRHRSLTIYPDVVVWDSIDSRVRRQLHTIVRAHLIQ